MLITIKVLGFILSIMLSTSQLSWGIELDEPSSVGPWETEALLPQGIAGKLFMGLGIRDVIPELGNVDLLSNSGARRLQIPLEAKYSSYSAIFVCRDLAEEQSRRVPSIYKAFRSFAFHIGSRNAGVWIGQDAPPTFDVGAGKNACDFFRLTYNGGPYVVHYKIEDARPKTGAVEITLDSTIINFHGVQTERIPMILNILEQGIRTGQIANGWLRYEQVRQVLLSFMSENSDFVKEIIAGTMIYARPRGSVSLQPSPHTSTRTP